MWLIAIAAVLVYAVAAGRKVPPVLSGQPSPGTTTKEPEKETVDPTRPAEEPSSDIEKVVTAAFAGAAIGGTIAGALGANEAGQATATVGGAATGVALATTGVTLAAPVAAFTAPIAAVAHQIYDKFDAAAKRGEYEKSRVAATDKLSWDWTNANRYVEWMKQPHGLFLGDFEHFFYGVEHGQFIAVLCNESIEDVHYYSNKTLLVPHGVPFYFEDKFIRFFDKDGKVFKEIDLKQPGNWDLFDRYRASIDFLRSVGYVIPKPEAPASGYYIPPPPPAPGFESAVTQQVEQPLAASTVPPPPADYVPPAPIAATEIVSTDAPSSPTTTFYSGGRTFNFTGL